MMVNKIQENNFIENNTCPQDVSKVRPQQCSISERQFLNKCHNINYLEKRIFTYLDFPEMNRNTFNKKVTRCGDKITRIGRSHTGEYVLKEVKIQGLVSYRPQKGTGPSHSELEYEKILSNCKNQKPAFHKIKLSFDSNLHGALLAKGLTTNQHNSSISINDPSLYSFSPNITFRLTVYPSKVIMDIGCTMNPIWFDSRSLTNFTGDICRYIQNIEQMFLIDFSSCPVSDFNLIDFHLNKDSILESAKISHLELQWFENNNVCYRLYSKDFGDSERMRLEQEMNKINKPLSQFTEEVSTGKIKWNDPEKIPKGWDISK